MENGVVNRGISHLQYIRLRQSLSRTGVIIFLALFHSVNSQDYECYQRYSSEEGLSQSVVNCMIQDQEGFLWIGTQDGLNCFDGYSFVHYQNQPSDLASISNNYVTSLCEDHTGFIWAGTMGGGLNRLDKKTRRFTVFRNTPGNTASISDNTVWALAVDSTNAIWAGTYKGLNIKKNGSEEFIRYGFSETDTSSLPNDLILSLYYDCLGKLWIGTGTGLALFNFTQNNFTRIHPSGRSIQELIIWSVNKGNGNGLLLGTNNGVWKYTVATSTLSKINGYQNNDSVTVWTVMGEGKDHFWSGTTQGINLFNSKEAVSRNLTFRLREGELPEETNVWCLFKDRSGTIWAGTGAGLLGIRSSENTFRSNFSDDKGDQTIMESTVNTVLKDRTGTLWIGTEGSGLLRFDDGSGNFISFVADERNQNSIANNYIWSLFEDREGLLWIGTYGAGLNSYNRNTGQFINYRRNESDTCAISNNRIFTILEDNAGYIWIGTRGSGLNRYDKKTGCFEEFSNDPSDSTSLSSNIVLSLAFDNNGTMWVGTFDGGLCCFVGENKGFRTYRNDGKAGPDNCIWSILFGSENRMWLGTQSGLYVSDYKPEKLDFRCFNSKHGLPGNVILGLAEDGEGNIWMSTFRGIAKLNIDEFERIDFSVNASESYITDPFHSLFSTFDTRDGLQGNEFSQGAYHRAKDGTIYFGGAKGLTYFYPDSMQQSRFDPPVKITGFKIFNREVGIAEPPEDLSSNKNSVFKAGNEYFLPCLITYLDEIILTWRESVFSFEFSSLDFSNTSKNQYAYLMEGFETGWNFVGNKTSATYTNLNPGNYTFRVRGTNSSGKWSTKEAELQITILPPFWRTQWFIALVILLVLLALVLTVLQIIRSQRKKAFAEKEKIELQLRTIKNQIDPHFAFNAINMIGSMVYNKDPDTVYDYFSRFARLIRSTLQDSEKISRTLSEELDFVQNYISIQKTRFADKFTFALVVDEKVDLNTQVPKMIIQTYAENAIKHGLMHKKEEGKLEIRITEKEKRLMITVEDNGIGREKAAELSKGSTKKGMQIIQQIFTLYNKLIKYKISQEIIDLKDDGGNALGTKVVLTIDKN